MKQLVLLSGKGGTGKTSISAAFAHLLSADNQNARSVFVDADVDAANLSLVLKPQESTRQAFWGGSLAEINAGQCTGCGNCSSVCRYDAVIREPKTPSSYRIDPIACDGCAACVYACPQQAVSMTPQQAGHWFHSSTAFGDLFHAELFPGKENSGKLVTLVKQQARLWAEETFAAYVVIDGPPGIGCPVISACAGTSLGLIVTEPGVTGLHDLKRILGTLQHFRIPSVICINKASIFPLGTKQIREYAEEKNIDVLGEIPFDDNIPRSIIQGAPITSIYPDSSAARSIHALMEATIQKLADQQAT
jgi:MinD superfamily P-loop ATPase